MGCRSLANPGNVIASSLGADVDPLIQGLVPCSQMVLAQLRLPTGHHQLVIDLTTFTQHREVILSGLAKSRSAPEMMSPRHIVEAVAHDGELRGPIPRVLGQELVLSAD